MYTITHIFLAIKIRFLAIFYRRESLEIDLLKARMQGEKQQIMALYVYLYKFESKYPNVLYRNQVGSSDVKIMERIYLLEGWQEGHKIHLKKLRQEMKESNKRINRNNIRNFFMRAN